MNLCSPVLKVMYCCDSEDNSENKYWRCIVLHCHPRLLLYLLWDGRGLQENSPECTFRLRKNHLLWTFKDLGATEEHDIGKTVQYIYFQRHQSFLWPPKELVVFAGVKKRLLMTRETKLHKRSLKELLQCLRTYEAILYRWKHMWSLLHKNEMNLNVALKNKSATTKLWTLESNCIFSLLERLLNSAFPFL